MTVVVLGIFGTLSAFVPALVQTEPAPIDPRPIVAFLGAGDHAQWRYLTLGFGDQMGLVNALSDASTLDGEFFTARRLPMLTDSGIATIDFSLLWDPSADLLRRLLADPVPHSLRWVFTRHPSYERIMAASGWRVRQTLANSVDIWEAPDPVPMVEPAPTRTGLLAVWWGVVPLGTLGSLVPIGLWWRSRRASQ